MSAAETKVDGRLVATTVVKEELRVRMVALFTFYLKRRDWQEYRKSVCEAQCPLLSSGCDGVGRTFETEPVATNLTSELSLNKRLAFDDLREKARKAACGLSEFRAVRL